MVSILGTGQTSAVILPLQQNEVQENKPTLLSILNLWTQKMIGANIYMGMPEERFRKVADQNDSEERKLFDKETHDALLAGYELNGEAGIVALKALMKTRLNRQLESSHDGSGDTCVYYATDDGFKNIAKDI